MFLRRTRGRIQFVATSSWWLWDLLQLHYQMMPPPSCVWIQTSTLPATWSRTALHCCVRVWTVGSPFESIKLWPVVAHVCRCIAVHPVMPCILSSSDDMLIKLWDWDKVRLSTTLENYPVGPLVQTDIEKRTRWPSSILSGPVVETDMEKMRQAASFNLLRPCGRDACPPWIMRLSRHNIGT